MKSTTGRGTIRFTGFIQDHKIQTLIDGGSSDNFIQPRLAKFLPTHLSDPTIKSVGGQWRAIGM